MMTHKIPTRLEAIIQDFEYCEGREKLELLIQFSESLPELPERFAQQRAGMAPVPECMSPVYLFAETEAGKLHFYFDVPMEAPTVRGFAAIMQQGLEGATPDEVLQVPGDFYQQMGLQGVLSQQRLNGMAAILAHMKQLAVREIES
jgi:cysteine desulfuration protein SufE